MAIFARYPKRFRKTSDVETLHTEAVYTVAEVALLRGYLRWTMIRLFENEPGLLIRRHPEKMHKRGRRAMRIPRGGLLAGPGQVGSIRATGDRPVCNCSSFLRKCCCCLHRSNRKAL
jgi:hypothetical protein